jgi:hypothetical protein
LIVSRRHGPSLIGRVFPRLTAREGDVMRDFDALCGNGFALIGIDVDDDTLGKIAHLSPWAKIEPACVSVAVNAAAPNAGFAVADGRQKKLLAPHSGEIAILRPDRYTAAIATPDQMLKSSHVLGREIGLRQHG